MITSWTRMLGLIGWPVDHSLSPVMQNAALEACGIDAVYTALPVAPERLVEAIQGLRALGFIGVNVTIPHKIGAAKMMDELTPMAKAIGAINTIRIDGDGRLIGHNTDVLGATRALQQSGFNFKGSTVAILGAGGAGRSVAAGCAFAGASKVLLLNRTVKTAEEIVEEFRSLDAIPSEVTWEADGFEERDWEEVDAVMQMTSLGLKGDLRMPVDPGQFPERCQVLEAVYAPLETPFLAAARAKGLRTTDGLDMLIEQGALSFEFWFGRAPDRGIMRAALQNALTKQ